MTTTFSGFPEELFDFLRDLRGNNNRDWFNANKERYREVVVNPVSDFIGAMAPKLEKISKHYIADPRANGGSMFRIYRDTRFAKDKRPYKTNVGCQFRHQAGKDAHAPGFYVHLEPDHIFFGGGVWTPPGPVLSKVREAIVEKPDEWQRIVKNKTFKTRFGELKGDRLKRPPRGFDADHPLLEDLKCKSFIVMQEEFEPLATNKDFTREVERAFKAASPLMAFVTKALELPY